MRGRGEGRGGLAGAAGEVALIGFGFGFAWLLHGFCLRVSSAPLLSDPGYLPMYAVLALAGEMAGFLAWPAARIVGASPERAYPRLAAASCLAGAALFTASSALGDAYTVSAAGLATGLAASSFLLLWVRAMRGLSTMRRGLALALGVVLGAAWDFAFLAPLSGVPAAASPLGVSAGELACFWASRRRGTWEAAPGAGPREPLSANPRRNEALSEAGRMVVCAVALSLVAPAVNYAVLGDAIGQAQRGAVICLGQAVVAALVLAMLKLVRRPPRTRALFLAMAPLLAVALFFVPFAGSGYGLAVLFLGACLYASVLCLAASDSIDLGARFGLDPAAVFGVSGACMSFCYYAVEQAMITVTGSGAEQGVLVPFVVFFVLYAMGFAFLAAQGRAGAGGSYFRGEEPRGAQAGGAAPGALSSEQVEKACRECIRSDHDLTDRELDVMMLAARGRSVPAVADELCISQNTVKSHLKRVYRVLNVHSRQELADYCDAVADEVLRQRG